MAAILRSCDIHRTDVLVSFLVIGAADLCENISNGLHKSAKENKWKIIIHQCESVDQVLKSNVNISIDFIIFAFDSRVSISLLQVEMNIGLIDEYFITSGTCCLVHCNGTLDVMGSVFQNLKEIRNRYNIQFLSANTFNSDNCIQLGHRILNLALAVLGLESGIPMFGHLLNCSSSSGI